MPGLYPATPNYRLRYHRDGSTGFRIDGSNNITQLSGSELTALNNESDDAAVNTTILHWGIIFPEAIDLTNYFAAANFHGGGTPAALATSSDTTDGLNGNWTTRENPWTLATLVRPGYRSAIQTVAGATGIKAVRFTASSGSGKSVSVLHLYGAPVAGTNQNLRIWEPGTDAEHNPSHFYDIANNGDVAQGGSYDVTFRVKNLHATETAQSVVVSAEGLAGSTIPAAWITFSQGGSFASSQNIGNLASGAISGVLTARIALPSNADLNTGSPAIIANASGGWA